MAKKKDGREKRHDSLVNKLEVLLFNNHDYDKMWKFFEYCQNGEVGEVDLLAMADQIYDFYEVKCTFNNKNRNKALQQYERFRRAFPKEQTNGFLYCGEGIIRL